MVVETRRFCPRCASVIAIQERNCRRCGLELHGGVERAPVDRFRVAFLFVHGTTGVFVSLMYYLARGSDLETFSQLLFAVVVVSFAAVYRLRPQYPVIKERRRARRLKKKRVAVFASAGVPLSAQTVRILGTVAWVAESRVDQVVVRTDSRVTTTRNDRSDLLLLAPVEPGDMFTTLLRTGRMTVGIWLLDPRFLLARRISVPVRRRLRGSLSLGQGAVLVMNTRT